MENIRAWLYHLDEIYDVLHSRVSETPSTSGWNPKPLERPCECRLSWRKGKLCLLCDNTRIRKCWPGEEGIDLYALGAKAKRGGFSAKSAEDESEAQKQAARFALLNARIEALERSQRIRDGIEAVEDSLMRKLRMVEHKPYALVKIELALRLLQADHLEDYENLPEGEVGLLRLAAMIPGRIAKPPSAGGQSW
jgi:hypothetical protein